MSTMIDPSFHKAEKEIRQILQKYNLSASVFLGSEKGTHTILDWQKSWNLIKTSVDDNGAIKLSIKAKSSDKSTQEPLYATVAMIYSFCDHAENLFNVIHKFLKPALEVKLEIEHDSLHGKTPYHHREEN